MNENILEINGLNISTEGKKIVDNLSISLKKGRVLGIVGESGSGKSMTMYALTNLLPDKTFNLEGDVIVDGTHIFRLNKEIRRRFCSDNIAIILQDAINALNPYKKISQQLLDTICLHTPMTKRQALQKAGELLEDVGLPGSLEAMERYPHEYSGGMRQRIAIVLCLCCHPKLLIADEPTTSLDAINQLKLLQLIKDTCTKRKIDLIYISHNLGLVASICDEVVVLCKGKVIESGTVSQVFGQPKGAYTQKLVHCTKALLGDI